jgi:hypothetical protein
MKRRNCVSTGGDTFVSGYTRWESRARGISETNLTKNILGQNRGSRVKKDYKINIYIFCLLFISSPYVPTVITVDKVVSVLSPVFPAVREGL